MKKIKNNNIRLSVDDMEELFNKNWSEDREIIKEMFNNLKAHMNEKEDYAINGITLTKLLEIMQKQTGQLLEYIKINKKDSKVNDDYDDKELEKIYKEIKSNSDDD